MSRDERKCRRAAIDPAWAAPAPNADQSAIHYHLRELQFLRCTNSASGAMHVKTGAKRLSFVQVTDYIDLQAIKSIKIRIRILPCRSMR